MLEECKPSNVLGIDIKKKKYNFQTEIWTKIFKMAWNESIY